MNNKTNLAELSLAELRDHLVKIGEKSFRAQQIWNWIYRKGVWDFSLMVNFTKDLQEKLQQYFLVKRPQVTKDLISRDGTRKWLLKFCGNQEIEMVFIPEKSRGTLCVSSQIGCTLTCKFCHTGTQMLVRNLTVGEIVSQFMIAKDLLSNSPDASKEITNIVFMGMGEPFFNYDNVSKSIKILNSDEGINFSKKRIIVSTSGVVPELIKFADEIKSGLAVSLHSADNAIRSDIMPINKKYPLEKLMEACKYYNTINPSQRITFEYVMLKDVNDSDQDARDLVNLIKNYKLSAKFNLIPFNAWEGSIYQSSSRNRIMSFSRIVEAAGFSAPIRKTRGQDVMAACGQLKSASLRGRV